LSAAGGRRWRVAGAYARSVLVLALDTSSPAVSVALVDLEREDDPPTGEVARWGRAATWQRVDAQRHGELLATGVAAVLAELRASRSSVSAVAVGVGPGPFTGLRVGIVTGLAMADALGVPAYGCCSLDAVGAWDEGSGPRLVVMDARRKEVYWAEYDADGQRVAGPAVSTPAALAGALTEAGWEGRVVGDGALRYRDHFDPWPVEAADARYPAPDALVLLAARRVLDGAPTEALTPLYLRRPDAVPPAPPKRVTA
jgi:tRNA threonylcarbamoyl adenosine modification protein YeaZ